MKNVSENEGLYQRMLERYKQTSKYYENNWRVSYVSKKDGGFKIDYFRTREEARNFSREVKNIGKCRVERV
jgi:hypothetical protein